MATQRLRTQKVNSPDLEPYWHPTAKTVSPEGMKAFAQRLHNRMLERGLSQADLARAVFGTDAEGKVLGRDKISKYLRAVGLPGEEKMRRLSASLGMTLAELAPRIDTSPVERKEDKKRHQAGGIIELDDDTKVQLLPDGMVVLTLTLPNELAEMVRKYARRVKQEMAA